MFKLIDSGTDFNKFDDGAYGYDFPIGLVLISDVNKWFLVIGEQPSGNRTNGCDCCSSYYDLNWLRHSKYNRWELYEYQLQTKE